MSQSKQSLAPGLVISLDLITRLKVQMAGGLAETPVGTSGSSLLVNSSSGSQAWAKDSLTKPAGSSWTGTIIGSACWRGFLARGEGTQCGGRTQTFWQEAPGLPPPLLPSPFLLLMLFLLIHPWHSFTFRPGVRAGTPCVVGTVLSSCSSVSELCHIFGTLFPTCWLKLFW